MKKDSFFSRCIQWLKNSEMFARPSKQLPGKWELYEFYTEPGEELIHKDEVKLKEEQLYIKLVFSENGEFNCDSNLPGDFISDDGSYSWSVSKNFLTLIHEEDFRNNEEFQFAIATGTLKLLKKDDFGKIILFGFFRKVAEVNN